MKGKNNYIGDSNMRFEEALAAMREGKEIKRKHWASSDKGMLTNLNLEEILADDWEIYEEPKWQPRNGEWYVNVMGSVTRHCELRKEIIDFGIVRQTREQTEKARDKMRVFNRLLAYVDEHAPDYDPDKEPLYWHVKFDRKKESWFADTSLYSCEYVGCVYMPKEVAKQLVDDLNSGRVVL